MRSFFSKAELNDLVALKNQLAVTPATYFFIYVDTLDTLKEIATPMLSLQWHFLRKGLSDIVNCFGYLGQLSKAIIDNDSNKISKAFNNVLHSSISAMASIGLDLGLCCLHTLRLFSLVISKLTLVSLKIVLTIPSLFSDDRAARRIKLRKESDYKIDILGHRIAEVGCEKTLLVLKIQHFMDAKASTFSLFSNQDEEPILLNGPITKYLTNQELANLGQIFQELLKNIKNYPGFKASKAYFDKTYIDKFLRDLDEHHNVTTNLAELFIKNNDRAEFLLWKHKPAPEKDSDSNGFRP